jgi:hypothetical protein
VLAEAGPPGAVTGISGARARRQKRARSNITGVRAETVPPPRTGETVFRLVPDTETLRAWGRKHGFAVSASGPVRKEVRDHFSKWNAWSVRIVSVQVDGDTQARQFFKVMQGPYVRKMTRDLFYVKRELGEELFPLLKEVKNP